jgi:hypothetical protein
MQALTAALILTAALALANGFLRRWLATEKVK